MNCIRRHLSDGRVEVEVTIPLDPANLSTAQQKLISWKQHRVFTNAKVSRGMRNTTLLARPFRRIITDVVPWGTPVHLTMTFYFAYPKNTPKKILIDDAPQPQRGDCDNRAKAEIDALTHAGWWEDDRYCTTEVLRKRLTTGEPRIVIKVKRDT